MCCLHTVSAMLALVQPILATPQRLLATHLHAVPPDQALHGLLDLDDSGSVAAAGVRGVVTHNDLPADQAPDG